MKKTMYIILKDTGQDLGEGYSSSSYNEFLGIVKSFETARNIIEYLVDIDIGEENPNYKHCEDCQEDCCLGCPYYEQGIVDDEDWNEIKISIGDIFNTCIRYHFKRIEVEV